MSNKYILSIRVSPDGFFLYILDEAGKTLMSRHVTAPLFSLSAAEIIDLFQKESAVLDSEYLDIHLVVDIRPSVFIPETFFQPQDVDSYFYFQYPQNEKELVLFNRIEKWEVVNVFSIPGVLYGALNELFPDISIVHQLTYFLLDRVNTKEDSLYLWVQQETFYIVVIKEHKLLLVNTFNYSTSEDVAYYVLSIFEQLSLDVEKMPVKIFQKDKSANVCALIAEYIRNCEVILQ